MFSRWYAVSSIFVGEIIDPGVSGSPISSDPLESPSTGPDYVGVKVRFSENLRGTLDNHVFFSIIPSTHFNEVPPKVGTSYIFFVQRIERGSDQFIYRVVKLLPATEDNITMVKTLAKYGYGSAEPNKLTDIPAGPWEKHKDGIALDLNITSWKENDQKYAIKAYVVNTSNEVLYLSLSGPDGGMHIFYIDSDGKKVPLRNHLEVKGGRKEMINAVSVDLRPGECYPCGTELTSDELVKVKSNPVECEFELYDLSAKKLYTFESTPRMLETSTVAAP
jgi:hypothetical protein